MKKTLCLLLTLIIAFSLTCSVSAASYYEDGIKYDFMTGLNAAVVIGDDGTFVYSVYACGMSGLTNGDMTITYDTSVVEFVSCSDDSSADMFYWGEGEGEVYVSFIYSSANESSVAKLFSMTFKGDGSSLPSVVVTNLVGSFYKSVYTPIVIGEIGETSTDVTTTSVQLEEESVTLVYTRGDIDGSGKITVSDARLALRIATRLEVATDEQISAADINGDGKVTVSDARAILRFTSGIENFPSLT